MRPRALPKAPQRAAIHAISSDLGDMGPSALMGAVVALVVRSLVAVRTGMAG
jgi:hypothetical protein